MSRHLQIIFLLSALIIIAILFPMAASVWFQNLAHAQIARAATAPPGNAALAQAFQHLEQARQFANEPRLSLASARVALAQNNPARAFDALASANPNDFIAQLLRGNAAYQLQKNDEALLAWRKAGAQNYFTNLAHRAFDKHDWVRAEKFARLALMLEPDSADLHWVLGEALSRQDVNSVEAWRELEHAEALAPNDELRAVPISRRGEILATQKKYPDAIATFERAIQVAPMDARPRTGLALAKLQLDPGSRTQAIALLTQVVNDSPWYTAAYIALAQLDREPETWLKRGLAKNPNDARLLLPLGEWYAKQNRVDDARATLERAVKNETRLDARAELQAALDKLK